MTTSSPDEEDDKADFGLRVFHQTFEPEHGQFVLVDLRAYCGAATPDVYCAEDGRIFLALDHPHFTAGSDAEKRGENLGRLRAYERIRRFVRMPERQIDAAAKRVAERLHGGDE